MPNSWPEFPPPPEGALAWAKKIIAQLGQCPISRGPRSHFGHENTTRTQPNSEHLNKGQGCTPRSSNGFWGQTPGHQFPGGHNFPRGGGLSAESQESSAELPAMPTAMPMGAATAKMTVRRASLRRVRLASGAGPLGSRGEGGGNHGPLRDRAQPFQIAPRNSEGVENGVGGTPFSFWGSFLRPPEAPSRGSSPPTLPPTIPKRQSALGGGKGGPPVSGLDTPRRPDSPSPPSPSEDSPLPPPLLPLHGGPRATMRQPRATPSKNWWKHSATNSVWRVPLSGNGSGLGLLFSPLLRYPWGAPRPATLWGGGDGGDLSAGLKRAGFLGATQETTRHYPPQCRQGGGVDWQAPDPLKQEGSELSKTRHMEEESPLSKPWPGPGPPPPLGCQ